MGQGRKGVGEEKHSQGILSGPSFHRRRRRRALGPLVLLTQKPNKLGSKVRCDGSGGHGSCFKMYMDFVADPTRMVDYVRSSDSSAPKPEQSLLVLWDRAQTP